ncbi:MAG: catalase [Methanoregula sp.]|nr:catalase [Methanoregula sp.]
MAKKILTTNPGVPFSHNQNSLAAGQRAPILLQDLHRIVKQEMVV